MDWQFPQNEADIISYIRMSQQHPVCFFKHSDRCSISSVAKRRFESHHDQFPFDTVLVLVNVISQRPLSLFIESMSGIPHESPQLLLFKQEKCVYHASHFAIEAEEIIPLLRNNEM
jgi:bacillithiol system protein YtxJ